MHVWYIVGITIPPACYHYNLSAACYLDILLRVVSIHIMIPAFFLWLLSLLAVIFLCLGIAIWRLVHVSIPSADDLDKRFAGKVIWITGASSGIGKGRMTPIPRDTVDDRDYYTHMVTNVYLSLLFADL